MGRLIFLLLTAVLISTTSTVAAENNEDDAPHIRPDDPLPQVTAHSAIVMEAKTGTILYARDIDTKRYPASTTKMMTLITALAHGNLDDMVRISHRAAEAEGSTLWLEEGDRVRMEELLTGMMMVSGNDGAMAVAEHIGGNVPRFAALMNDMAREVGAYHTHFVNPSGLPDEHHYTTARDLALIAAHGYANPDFVRIVSTKEKHFNWVKDPTHFLRNENQLLWLFTGANGVKTGYTDAAGRCLVSGAIADGVQIIAVVLDSTYMWDDSIALLKYGASKVKSSLIVKRGENMGSVAVRYGERKTVRTQTAMSIRLPIAADIEYEKRVEHSLLLSAPIKKGDVVGQLIVSCEGRDIESVDLIAAEDMEVRSFFLRILDFFKNLF